MDLCLIKMTHTRSRFPPARPRTTPHRRSLPQPASAPGGEHTRISAANAAPGPERGEAPRTHRREEKQLTGMCLRVPFPLYQKQSG